MKNILYVFAFLPFIVSATTIPVVVSPYNDMKPSIASYDISSPTFTMAWERGDTTSSCTIYVSTGDSNLTNIAPVRLTTGSYIDKNPVVTYVDSLHPMVIWERKSGSYFQLYSSCYQGNSAWSDPEQVYSILGNETYPYPSGEDLYFESLDRIYYVYYYNNTWNFYSIVSDVNDSCYHPSFSVATGVVYDVNSNGAWAIHQEDSLFTNTSSAPMFPMVTSSGNYLYTQKIGNIYYLILYNGNTYYTIDTSDTFLGHHKMVDVGITTRDNIGDLECYVKDDSNREVYAFNRISKQKYLLNSGNYDGDYPSMCVINGYRTLYKVPLVFQEMHDGKWDIYGDILPLTNGGIKLGLKRKKGKGIEIKYLNGYVIIRAETYGKVFNLYGTPVSSLKIGVNKIKFGSIPQGIYFIKLKSGKTKKLIIQ